MTKPLRCWHLLSNRWNSAITEYALSAARALSLHGTENLFTPLKGSPAEKRALGYGMNVHAFASFGVGAVPEVLKVRSSFAPDVVFVYGGPETFLARFSGAGKKVRFRGSELIAKGFAAFSQRLSHSHIDVILVPGSPLEHSCAEIFGSERVRRVILGCDTQTHRFRDDVLSPTRPEILIFGRFDPVKGHREFFKIFAEMLRQWPADTERPLLTVAGEPANVTAEMLRASAKELGLANDVQIITGRFPDVSAPMSSATLGVVSSLGSEQICRVAEEFLLCGTPVAVSGVGSLEDVLFEDGSVSYRGLSTEQAAEVLVQKTIKSYAESKSAKKFRSKDAENLFSLHVMGEHLLRDFGIQRDNNRA